MRKSAEVVISSDGRDRGKKFVITEMAAAQGEAWGFRALGAMSRGGIDIAPSIFAMGMAGISVLGLKAFLAAPYDEARPLLDEMFECVKRIEDKAPQGRVLVENDIEEIETRLRLRDEVLKLHVNFSIAETLSKGLGQLTQILTAIDTSAIPMSDPGSQPSSEVN